VADGALANGLIGEEWQAWFDGSALPNPGRIGIGYVLRDPVGRCHEGSYAPHTAGCNNEAELQALCALLTYALEQGVCRLQVYGDSHVAVQYVSGADSTQIARLQVWIEEARRLLSGFETVLLKWVPRHRNLRADSLSRHALGLPEKPAVVAVRKK
jgi:ribonuclease HI